MGILPTEFLPQVVLAAMKAGQSVFGPGFTGQGWACLSETQEQVCLAYPAPRAWDALAVLAQDIPKGGAVAGFIGYEAAMDADASMTLPKAPDALPLVWASRFAKIDHVATECADAVSASGSRHLPRADACLDGISGADYEAQVRDIIAAIRDGEIFQANISRATDVQFPWSEDLAATLFAQLMGQGIAPYAAYLPLEEAAVLSNSPELFFRQSGQKILAEPIKGTRPRGATAAEDQRLVNELLYDEKDRAENIMIADLLRNDLAKVCTDYSIVEKIICGLRTLPYVHHLYSQIGGQARGGVTPIDVAKACFPCGSITGAPKHRAMQHIARLEGEGRGAYCGSVFYIPEQGEAVFSVAIRTATLYKKDTQAQMRWRSGGGITTLSDPRAEFEETQHKAQIFEVLVR